MTYYKQCMLEKKTDNGTIQQTCWIPEVYSKLHSTIKIKNESNEWVDGWVVKLVSEERVEEKQLPDSHSAIKGHRQATGDASPKVR